MKNPRAYDTGGFGVGARILRVEIIGRMENHDDRYLVRVTSPSGRGYTRGEIMEASYRDLWDHYSISSGPKCNSRGKTWKAETSELPIYYLSRNYQNMTYAFINLLTGEAIQ